MTPDEFLDRLQRVGMSQSSFSRFTGLGQPHISRYASGQRNIPPIVEALIMLLDEIPAAAKYARKVANTSDRQKSHRV